jgi:endonuclease G
VNKMLTARVVALICAMAWLPVPVSATGACDGNYLAGTRPTGAAAGTELCSGAYAVLWNPATRDPAYAAEHLTADGLQHAKATPRGNGFRADTRLPADQRATLADYRGSRLYDRGHMAPDHDMPSDEAAHESFLLSNMVPQVKANNRGPWAQIEESVRDLVVSVYQGEGWVVTGPAFGTEPKLLHGHVAVPSQLWKALYVPGNAQLHTAAVVGAWVVDNATDPKTQFIDLNQLQKRFGVDPFPTLSPELHAAAALPAPVAARTHVTVH